MITSKIFAPSDWGTLKSNTHYGEIDGAVCAIRPTKDFILYKGRWRPIETDTTGCHTVHGPGFSVSFEIKEFSK
jgi:hypothetical protein